MKKCREDDLSTLPEILEKHDLSMDGAAGNIEQFKKEVWIISIIDAFIIMYIARFCYMKYVIGRIVPLYIPLRTD